VIGLDEDQEQRERIIDGIRKLTPKQRAVILGKMATLQAFDDDAAADRWLERNREAILAQIKDAK